jgi:hypothetical protein
MSKPLDAMTPMHYLAHVLTAEKRRKELGLPEDAPVITTRWLVTREDYRAEMVQEAERWASVSMGSIAAAERALEAMPAFAKWQADELAQAKARGDQ